MMHRYYMSFAQDGFLGAIITEADSEEEAYGSTLYNRINPGGEVAIVQIPDEATNVPDREYFDKLLNKEQLDGLFGAANLTKGAPPSDATVVCSACNSEGGEA